MFPPARRKTSFCTGTQREPDPEPRFRSCSFRTPLGRASVDKLDLLRPSPAGCAKSPNCLTICALNRHDVRMAHRDRDERLIEFVRAQVTATVEALSREIGVGPSTIRRANGQADPDRPTSRPDE